MRNIKRRLNLFILIILSIDIIIGFFLFKSRAFPRLAMWHVVESDKQADFYWKPNHAPKYFYFEPYSQELVFFRKEISDLIKDRDNDLEKALIIAHYVMDLGKNMPSSQIAITWDSPYNMLRQINQGKQASCFPYTIIFSSYMASIGIKSRLWALEGDDSLGRFGHTVAEVYIKNLNKWVMIDVINRLYFKEKNLPLSILELRERLLNKKTQGLTTEGKPNRFSIQKDFFSFYTRLVKMVFLRTANDFINKYDAKIRYGRLSILQELLDKFPSAIRRGLNYFLGRKDCLVHYVDRFDKSLKSKIIFAKISFYFLVISLIFIAFLSLFSVRYLKTFFKRR